MSDHNLLDSFRSVRENEHVRDVGRGASSSRGYDGARVLRAQLGRRTHRARPKRHHSRHRVEHEVVAPVAHARLLAVALQHELTIDDVKRLDQMIVDYTQLFNQIPEYAGLFKHFLTHIVVDIYRYGPGRG